MQKVSASVPLCEGQSRTQGTFPPDPSSAQTVKRSSIWYKGKYVTQICEPIANTQIYGWLIQI